MQGRGKALTFSVMYMQKHVARVYRPFDSQPLRSATQAQWTSRHVGTSLRRKKAKGQPSRECGENVILTQGASGTLA